MKKLIVIALVILGLGVQADETRNREITVTGKSSIKLSPDKATLRFSIINKDRKAEGARKDNEITAKKVLNAVRALGVKDKYIQLEFMQINEVKKYNNKTRTYDFDGYKATRSFVVELHKLDLLSDVIAAVTSNGSNELSDVEYGLQDTDSIKKQALANAMTNAMDKADLILSPLNSKRGKLLQANELSNDFVSYPRRAYKSTRMMSVAAAPIAEDDSYAAGQIEVEASVKAIFAISD